MDMDRSPGLGAGGVPGGGSAASSPAFPGSLLLGQASPLAVTTAAGASPASSNGYRDLKNEGRISMAGRDSMSGLPVTPRSAADSFGSKQDSRNSLGLRDSLGSLPLTPHSSNSTFDLSGTPLSVSNAFSMYSQVPVMDGNSWNLPVTPDMGEGKPGDKTCLICGDRATGLHYGIVSCEGCKGFFKRSICNKRVYRCSRNKNCVMSRKQRNRCQYCRLLKCLQMGMNRKAIREDGMPGGRNKSIGPVEISEEEIERIMSGKEFEEEEQQEASSTTNADGSLSFSAQANGMGGIQGLNGVGGLDLSALSYGSLSQGVLADKSQGSNTYMPGLPSYGNAHSMAIPTSMGHLDPQSATLLDQLLRAEDFDPLHSSIMVEDDYEVSKHELFCLLCKIADEMLFRQITWIKKLPFLSEISISDLSTLLTNTWHEISFLSALCVHKPQLFGEFGSIILKYQPTNEELEQFSDDGMEIVERTMYLSGKLHQMKITKEEFVCMKVINFLNQDVKNLRDAELIESVNKRFWYACQDYIEAQYPHQPARFRELMMCLPEIRYVTSKILDIPIEHLPLLFKAIMHSCKVNTGHPSICVSA
ncbi:nuclear receptor subfamily 6 group A member 1-like isoform X2 [Branchiostoma floridae x Branchiostoma belcheri]